MTDKVQKIREEVEKLKDELNSPDASSYTEAYIIGATHTINSVLDIIDSLQEEPVKIKKGCKYRCLSDMVNKDTGNISFVVDKIYLAPKDNVLVSEENGWLCDTSENASNFELVEEPVNEELEEEIGKELTNQFGTHYDDDATIEITAFDYVNIARHFAGLQKKKDSMPVSEELEKVASTFARKDSEGINNPSNFYYTVADKARIFKAGAKWQKENLWKPADGDDLPEYEREVVAFQEIFPTDVDVPSLLKIVIAHRPNPEGYDGKSLTTGEVEHYTPKTNDKGGWNIPDVKWWLDCSLPNMEED